MNRTLTSLRRGLPTLAVAAALVVFSATSGATAALVITGKQIKNNTVTSADIKNGSLGTSDLSSSAQRALKGAVGPAGPVGAPGAPGAAGPAGAAGASGVSGYQLVTQSVVVAPSSGGQVTTTCPAGKRLLGASSSWLGSYGGTQAEIDLSATKATAYAFNYLDESDQLSLDITCAVVS